MQKFLLLSFTLLMTQSILAQDKPELIVRLSSDEIQLGNYFSIQIQLWNEEKSSLIFPVMEEAEVHLVSNNSTVNSSEIKEEWIFKVLPLYEGTYYIPKMNIKLKNNQKINIDAIRFKVVPNKQEHQEVQCEFINPLTIDEFEYSASKKGLFKRPKTKNNEG